MSEVLRIWWKSERVIPSFQENGFASRPEQNRKKKRRVQILSGVHLDLVIVAVRCFAFLSISLTVPGAALLSTRGFRFQP